MTLGQKITNLRKARGMTQEELSEAVGVTRQTISKWELDASTPDLDYLCKLCDLFGVTADDLIRPGRETVEATKSATTPTCAPTPVSQPEQPPPSQGYPCCGRDDSQTVRTHRPDEAPRAPCCIRLPPAPSGRRMPHRSDQPSSPAEQRPQTCLQQP